MKSYLFAAAFIAQLLQPVTAWAGDDAVSLGGKVRVFAAITQGASLPPNSDPILMFAHSDEDDLVVSGIALVPEANARIEVPDGTVALLRIRSKNGAKRQRPDSEDLNFSAGLQIPVFVMGKWSNPATMWEIDTGVEPARFRTISQDCGASDWQQITPAK